jgi:hypothetical protein
MKPHRARALLLLIGAVAIVVGLIFLRASNRFESGIGLALLVIGGVSGIVYLGVLALREPH